MQQPSDLATLQYRVNSMEKDIAQLQTQLGLYETSRENELKLRSINETLQRLGIELTKISDRLDTMATQMTQQDKDAKDRDAGTRSALDKLQIRVLIFIVTTIFVAIVGVLISRVL